MTAAMAMQSPYQPREIDLKMTEEVYITHIEDPDTFYCQLVKDSDAVAEMEEILSQLFGQSSNPPNLTECVLGQACVAQYTLDNCWYRAEITGLRQNSLVDVRFVDYGNTEEVTASSLKVLPQSLLHKPLLSVHCSLEHVVSQNTFWSLEEVQEFQQLISDGEVYTATFVRPRQTGQYMVELVDQQGRDICKMFCLASNACYLGKSSMPTRGKEGGTGASRTTGFDMLGLTLGETVPGTVVYVKTPDEFWLLMSKQQPRLGHISERLAEEYGALGPQERTHPNPVPGVRCAAKFSVDQAWYRGLIKAVHDESCEVEFVDYGNTEVVSRGDVKELSAELGVVPSLALKCGLSNAFPTAGKWNDAESIAFEEMAIDREVEITVREVRPTMYLVQARDKETGQDLGEQMVKNGLAAARRGAALAGARTGTGSYPKGSVPLHKQETVYLSHVEGPEKFWLQLARDQNKIDDLVAQVQEFYTGAEGGNLAVSSVEEGKMLMGQFTVDEAWYRAVVEKVDGGTVTVRFVDYGNTDQLPLSSLREITPSFLAQAVCAFRCSLGPHPWQEGSKDLLEQLTAEGAACTFLSCQGDVALVQLEVAGQDVVERLTGRGPGNTATELARKAFPQYARLGQKAEQIYISHVDSPTDFWCQLSKHSRNIETFSETLNSFYTSGTIPRLADVKRGDPCVAMYSEDSSYYRAVVQDVQDRSVTVHFVDYGNTEQVSKDQIYEIMQELNGEPLLSTHCGLSMPPLLGGESCKTDAFLTLVEGKELTIQVISEEAAKYVVDVLDNGQSLTAILQGTASGSWSLAAGDAPPPASSPASSAPRNFPAPALPQGSFTCFVTFIESSEKIYVQQSGIEEELTRLLSSLTTAHSSGTHPPLADARRGMPCSVYFAEDSSWCRGRVVDLLGDQLKVQFVDYGNYITLPAQDVKPLDDEFISAPYAIECSLGQAGIDNKRLESLLVDVEIRCEFTSGKKARMMIEGEDVLVLLQKSLLAPADARFTFPELPSGEVGACLSHIDPSGEFCLQLTSRADEITKLQEKLNVAYYSSSPVTLESPDVDSVACVKFAEDDSWYRAKVDQVEGDGVTVTYVDFGNSSVVSKSCVKALLTEFLPVPCCAYRCKLVNAPKWKPSVMERFEALAFEEFKVQFQSSVPPYEVTARTLMGNVADLIREILPKNYPPQIPPRDTVPGVVTAIAEDGLFFVQILSQEQQLNGLVEAVQQLYGSSDVLDAEETVSFAPGSVCVAKFSEDECWYRALIRSVSGDQVDVLFVDYGNSETVDKALVKPHVEKNFLTVPPFAFECRLQGVSSWTSEYRDKFAAFAENKVVSVRFLSNVTPFTVEVTKSMLDLLGEATPIVSTQNSLPATAVAAPDVEVKRQAFPEQCTPDHGNCYMAVVNPDGTFCIQLAANDEKLESLSAKLCELEASPDYSKALPKDLVGFALGAKFTEDDCWYRCTVTQEDPETDTFTVLFVDYGNTDSGIDRSRLKPLSEECLASAPMAFRCCLAGKGEMSAEETAKLRTVSEDLMLLLKSATKTDSGLFSVALELDGADMLECLLENEDTEAGLDTNNSAVVPENHEPAGAQDITEQRMTGQEEATPQSELEDGDTGSAVQAVQDSSSNDLPGIAVTPPTPSLVLVEGHRVSASVSHIDSPGWFFVTLDAAKEVYEGMMESLFEHFSCLTEGDSFPPALEVGSVVGATFGEDGSWYRVRVEEMEGDSCTVLYLDHGNREKVVQDDLRQLPAEWGLEAVPALAWLCSLAGVAPTGDGWTEEDCSAFTELVNEKSVLVEVLCPSDDAFLVNVLYMGSDVGRQLVEQDRAMMVASPAGSSVRKVFSDTTLDTTATTTTSEGQQIGDSDADSFVDAEDNGGDEDTGADAQVADGAESDASEDVEKDAVEEAPEGDKAAEAAEPGPLGTQDGQEQQEEEEGEECRKQAEGGVEEEGGEGKEKEENEVLPKTPALPRDDLDESDQSESISTEVKVDPMDSAEPACYTVEKTEPEDMNAGSAEEGSPSANGVGASLGQTSSSVLDQALTESGMVAVMEKLELAEKDGGTDTLQLDNSTVASADAAASLSKGVPELSISFPEPLLESTISGDGEAEADPKSASGADTANGSSALQMDRLQVPQEEFKEERDAFEDHSQVRPLDEDSSVEESLLDPSADLTQLEVSVVRGFSPSDGDVDHVEEEEPEDEEDDFKESFSSNLSMLTEYDIIVPNTDSAMPELFYVMVKSSISNYEELQRDIQEYLDKKNFPEKWVPARGERCLALRDDEWLRADVMCECKDEKYLMSFVDIGGEMLVEREDLRPLPEELQLAEPYGMQCYLSGMQLDVDWSQAALEYFTRYLDLANLVIFVREYHSSSDICAYGVDLFRARLPSEPSLNDLMISKGFAQPLCAMEVEENQEELEQSFLEISSYMNDSLKLLDEESEAHAKQEDMEILDSTLEQTHSGFAEHQSLPLQADGGAPVVKRLDDASQNTENSDSSPAHTPETTEAGRLKHAACTIRPNGSPRPRVRGGFPAVGDILTTTLKAAQNLLYPLPEEETEDEQNSEEGRESSATAGLLLPVDVESGREGVSGKEDGGLQSGCETEGKLEDSVVGTAGMVGLEEESSVTEHTDLQAGSVLSCQKTAEGSEGLSLASTVTQDPSGGNSQNPDLAALSQVPAVAQDPSTGNSQAAGEDVDADTEEEFVSPLDGSPIDSDEASGPSTLVFYESVSDVDKE